MIFTDRIPCKSIVLFLIFLTFGCAFCNDAKKPEQRSASSDGLKAKEIKRNKDIILDRYRSKVSSHVNANWVQPEAPRCDGQTTSVEITILPDGSVKNVHFKKNQNAKS